MTVRFCLSAQSDTIKQTMRRSRLSKKTEKKSIQTIVLSFLGIAIILFLLFRYGIPLISDASFFFSRILTTGDDKKQNKDKETFVPVPELDTLPKVTKEDRIKITGTSLSGFSIALYLNGGKEDEAEVGEDGTFEFFVTLTEGENILKAQSIKGEKESEFSDSTIINYKKSGPQLSIDSPKDGESVSGPNPYNVTGKTEQDTIVTVNDFQAIISGDSWIYVLALKDGENEIKVVSVDLAGNKTEKNIKVNYSP